MKSKNTLCSWVIKQVFDCAWENLDVSFLHICYKYYFISVIKINFTCKAKHNLQTSSRSLLTCIINVLQISLTHSKTFRNNFVSSWGLVCRSKSQLIQNNLIIWIKVYFESNFIIKRIACGHWFFFAFFNQWFV